MSLRPPLDVRKSPREGEHDLAGVQYWDRVWGSGARQRPVDPNAAGVRNHLRRTFHKFFVEVLGDGRGRGLMEVGCADSIWLPYFRRELGFSVAGMDYSEAGCEAAQENLRNSGIAAEIFRADMYAPPSDLLGRFDVVFSYGLVEHFSDTAGAIAALRALCRPGGLLVTIVPNMTLTMGWLQRQFSETVYALHVPLSLKQLVVAHEMVEMKVERACPLLAVNFGVLVPASPGDSPLKATAKRIAHRALLASMIPVWAMESVGVYVLPQTKSLSPYFAVVARS